MLILLGGGSLTGVSDYLHYTRASQMPYNANAPNVDLITPIALIKKILLSEEGILISFFGIPHCPAGADRSEGGELIEENALWKREKEGACADFSCSQAHKCNMDCFSICLLRFLCARHGNRESRPATISCQPVVSKTSSTRDHHVSVDLKVP